MSGENHIRERLTPPFARKFAPVTCCIWDSGPVSQLANRKGAGEWGVDWVSLNEFDNAWNFVSGDPSVTKRPHVFRAYCVARSQLNPSAHHLATHLIRYPKHLAQLAGRDLWGKGETSATRAQFRKECREAFKDMQSAAGLSHWREEITGVGRTKSRRYHYQHAAPRQLELNLLGSALV